jgi:predicted MFS family arabinose efflux permease
MGWLISRAGWVAPFPVLAVLALIAAAVFFLFIPNVPRALQSPSLARAFQLVITHHDTLPLLLLGLLVCLSNGIVMIIYGVWLEGAFNLSPTVLGATAIVIGLAELMGEAFVAAFADRTKFRRSLVFAVGLNFVSVLCLPILSNDLLAALGGLFLFSLSFEFVLVCTIPMVAELVPDARATAMASKTAFQRTGFALGTLLGPLFFQMGIGIVAIASALATIGALVILILFVNKSPSAQTLGSSSN